MLSIALIEKTVIDAGFDIAPHMDGKWMVFGHSGTKQQVALYLHDTDVEIVSIEPSGMRQPQGHTSSLIELHEILIQSLKQVVFVSHKAVQEFKKRIKNLPATTEAERTVIARVGQDIFRAALLEYWDNRCAATGLAITGLLRASHIKPWAECENDEERLDVFNGLLLSPNLDALFDGGWISFDDAGHMLVAQSLSAEACQILGIVSPTPIIQLQPQHCHYMAYHRKKFGFLDS